MSSADDAVEDVLDPQEQDAAEADDEGVNAQAIDDDAAPGEDNAADENDNNDDEAAASAADDTSAGNLAEAPADPGFTPAPADALLADAQSSPEAAPQQQVTAQASGAAAAGMLASKGDLVSYTLLEDERMSAYGGEDGDAEFATLGGVCRSPHAELAAGAYVFVNTDFAADPEERYIAVAAPLSRQASADIGVHDVSALVPALRVASPTDVSANASQEAGDDASADAAANAAAEAAASAAAVPQPETIDRSEIILKIRAEIELREKHKGKNQTLQNKLAEYFKKKRADEKDSDKNAADFDQRYANNMALLAALQDEQRTITSQNDLVVADLKLKLAERQHEAEERTQEFYRFKHTTALNSENSRTGKAIPGKLLESLEQTDSRKETDVIAVRLENIKLRNKLKRNETLIKQKEELADGLHLIDFEQLKIENQSYNDKIEERNEELLKLRKKINNIVQVLTHVKEKLQFLQTENVGLRKTLRDLDEHVAKNRDLLPVLKHERDGYRNSNISLRQKHGLLGNKPLLRDYENKVDECDNLRARVDHFRAYHAELTAEILAIRRRIQKHVIAQSTLPQLQQFQQIHQQQQAQQPAQMQQQRGQVVTITTSGGSLDAL